MIGTGFGRLARPATLALVALAAGACAQPPGKPPTVSEAGVTRSTAVAAGPAASAAVPVPARVRPISMPAPNSHHSRSWGIGSVYQAEGPFDAWADLESGDWRTIGGILDQQVTVTDRAGAPVANASIRARYWHEARDWPAVGLVVSAGQDPGSYWLEGLRLDRNGQYIFELEIDAGGQHGTVHLGQFLEDSDLR